MGEALKEAYSDIFLIKEKPTTGNRDLILGKFKSYHNASDNVAKLHANTFYALLNLASLEFKQQKQIKGDAEIETIKTPEQEPIIKATSLGLHYNIQIHLPATKDVEVYNAIFKSLKDHLIE